MTNLNPLPFHAFDRSGQGEALSKAVALLRALGHEGRLDILCCLVGGEHNVSDLTEAVGRSQPSVSQQLMRLRAEGLVKSRRQGKMILYSIARAEVAQIVSALRDAFCGPEADPA